MALSETYDLIVIGGGSAGLTATTVAARVGAKVMLVDKSSLGGDCLHYGCVPSKALIASARLAHQMRRASDFGLGAVDVRVDIGAVMKRITAIKRTIGDHDSPAHFEALGAEVRFGGAEFLGAKRMRVGDDEVRFERAIIATGSRPATPEIEGLKEAGFLNNERLFSIASTPARLAVIGGGPIGCEMGQAMARLGAKVTIFQRGDRLLPKEAPVVSAHLRDVFEREGIEVRTNTSVERITTDGKTKVLHDKGGDELEVDEMLVAVGRAPTVDGLGLDVAKVQTNKRGVVVDDRLRTSADAIYAAGDVTGGPQFTHWAEHEARIAVRNALFLGSESRDAKNLPWVTFTDPEVARVGLTFDDANAHHDGVHVHRYEMDHLDRALTEGEPGGFAEVVVDKSARILGVYIVGHLAGETLPEWVLAMKNGLRLTDIGDTIHAYPTLARVNRRLADERFMVHGIASWKLKLGGRFKGRRTPDR